MDLEEALKMMDDAYKHKRELRIKKGHDYAKDTDIHLNFKILAELYEFFEEHDLPIPMDKPEGVAFWHILHKLVRILNLWKKDVEPENESLDDTHFDIENYSELAREMYYDSHKVNKTEE